MLQILLDHPVPASIVTLSGLSFILSVFFGFAISKQKKNNHSIVEQIDNLLPQTQCGQCGYPGCRPYAEAIAKGEAINQCPPGGQSTINQLAALLGVAALDLNPEHGETPTVKSVAYIHEDDCIGCTKCILACPVDAILGAAKQMHTVIVDECTGCDLCVEPCPVDCIEMIPVAETPESWFWPKPQNNIVATDQQIQERAA